MCILATIFQFFSNHKDAFEALKDLFEVVAIIVGGIWTYQIFILRRGKYPRAKLEQKVLCWPVAAGKIAVRVTVTIHNTGEVLLKLASGFTWLQQVKPLLPDFEEILKTRRDPVKDDETEVQWPLLGERYYFRCSKMEIEPGESDDVNSDFVIDSPAETLLIYSHIENETKSAVNCLNKSNLEKIERAENTKECPRGGIGWNVSTVVELSERHNGKSKA
jgi:hypothetical protein